MARTVSEVDGAPSNEHEVAVLLEALGFFKKDELEHTEFLAISKEVQRLVPLYSAQPKKPSTGKRPAGLGRNLRFFASGIAYRSVWSIMLTVLFAGGISLWATYPERLGPLSSQVAFFVGLGVLISFISTGGVQQVFSHRISYYRLQDNFPLAKEEARRGYVFGFLSIAIAMSAFLVANAVTHVFPLGSVIFTVLFLALLGSYLILVIPLYAYRKFHLIALGLIMALTCLYSVFYAVKYNGFASPDYTVVISQLVGLVTLNVITAIESLLVFRQKQYTTNLRNPMFDGSTAPLRNVRAPKLSVVLLEMAPLFVFGAMFYLILFFDRLIGWTATGVPFLLTYNTRYQLGADIALLVLIPLTGIIYYFSHGFYEMLETESSATHIEHRARLQGTLKAFVAKLFASIGLVACVSLFVLWQYAPLVLRVTGGDQESMLVFRFSLVAYSLLALFLANAFVSLAFRRCLVPALLLIVVALTDVGVNVISPRFAWVWHPVYGLLAGLFLATVIATVSTWRLIQHADYFYYSAF
jgi:hypothetical protein